MQNACGNPIDEVRNSVRCLRSSQVSVDSIKNIQVGQVDNDPKMKEYLLCMNKNAGIQDESGYFNNNMIEKTLRRGGFNDETIKEVLEACPKLKQTPEETAYEFMRCFYANTIFRKRY